MSDSIHERMERVRAYCAQLERLAFSIPPPNPICTQLVSLAIYIRSEAEAVQAENFAAGAQWSEPEKAKLLELKRDS